MIILIKTLLTIITLFFIGFIVFFLIKTRWLKHLLLYDLVEFFTLKSYETAKITGQWKKIKRKIKGADEGKYKELIIKADDLLAKALERQIVTYQATNYEERLNQVTSETLSNIEQICQAHEIAKKITQDRDYQLNLDQAKEILDNYEKAFKALEII